VKYLTGDIAALEVMVLDGGAFVHWPAKADVCAVHMSFSAPRQPHGGD